MTTDPEHQPTLPDLELPDYHGRAPVGMRTSLTGAGNRLTRPHEIGDRVVLVIEARVKRAGHEDTGGGLLYTETHKVADLFELDSAPGARLLTHLRSAYRAARDASEGSEPIPGLGDEGWTDANGVVLTAAELAERRNDPLALLGHDAEAPAVVVYDDGTRLLWPDEYGPGTPRPTLGTGDAERFVVDLLDDVTGESLGQMPAEVVDTLERLSEVAAEIVEAEEQLEEAAREVIAEADDDYSAGIDDWDNVTPLRRDEAPALPGEEELASRLPGPADFAFVDVTVPALREKLGAVVDVGHLRRLVEAEKQGRGRGLVARKGALDALYSRLAELGEVTP